MAQAKTDKNGRSRRILTRARSPRDAPKAYSEAAGPAVKSSRPRPSTAPRRSFRRFSTAQCARVAARATPRRSCSEAGGASEGAGRRILPHSPPQHLRSLSLIKHRGRNGNVANSQELPKLAECRLQRVIVDRRIVRSGQQRNADADEGHRDMLQERAGRRCARAPISGKVNNFFRVWRMGERLLRPPSIRQRPRCRSASRSRRITCLRPPMRPRARAEARPARQPLGDSPLRRLFAIFFVRPSPLGRRVDVADGGLPALGERVKAIHSAISGAEPQDSAHLYVRCR
jgi:hypothetical protein